MAHYNIYEDLGIDRSLDSARIVTILDERLAETSRDDAAEQDRLNTSRKLFEVDSRRAAYDRALDDPHHPEITIGSFRSFADGTFGTSASSGVDSSESSTTGASSFGRFNSNSAPSAGAVPSSSSGSLSRPASQEVSTPQAPAPHRAPEENSDYSRGPANHGPTSSPWNSPNGRPRFSPNSQHGFANGDYMGSAQNNQTGINQNSHAQVGFEMRSLAVSPGRRRTESLMWLIGWGLILLPWIYLLLDLLFSGNSSSSSWIAQVESASNLGYLIGFTLLHTIGMLILLNFLWHLRVFYGKKTGL